MSTAATTPPETFAEVLERLGRVPLDRILAQPAPGTATPADVLRLRDGQPKRLCELVDGILVEKPMGHLESRLAARLIAVLSYYLDGNDIGVLAGADGPHRLQPDLVRMPDVAFISYDRIPAGSDPATPMPGWIPNLAVEIISPGNTRLEMDRKRREYFAAGVEVFWLVDPPTRTVQVYAASQECRLLTGDDELDGGDVLPGFRLAVGEWFDRAWKISS